MITICACLLALQATAPEAAAPKPMFEFPAGAAGTAVAAIAADTKPAPTPADLGAKDTVPAVASNAFALAPTWDAWSTLVLAEAHARAPDPERRARLALFALEQGRSDDAWSHCAATSAHPEWTAAILPRFLPGVPRGSAIGVGGRPGALPDGVVLSPSLPPSSAARDDGRVDRRAMSVREIHIGRAVVSMRVSVESEGVQIDVRHVSGEPAQFSVLIPELSDWSFGDEYVDWYRQDEKRVPHKIEVKAGEEEHTFYGRFEARARTQPTRVPTSLPGSIVAGGLWFVIRDDDSGRALVASIADSLTARKFGFTCRVRAPGLERDNWSGVAFDVSAPDERAEKLRFLATALERFALGTETR